MAEENQVTKEPQQITKEPQQITKEPQGLRSHTSATSNYKEPKESRSW